MISKISASLLLLVILASNHPTLCKGAIFADVIKNKLRIMIVLKDGNNSGDCVGYAENLLKKGFKKKGAAIFNPEMMNKVKENKLLWQAIQNGNATAMAKIATDYGAVVLIRGVLSVDTRQKFAASWEGTASLSLIAVNTQTAEEIVHINSTPFGTALNPAPIEDSPLIAKQEAVRKVCDDVLVKSGILKSIANIDSAESIRFEFYDVFDLSGLPTTFDFSADGHYLYAAVDQSIQKWDLMKRLRMETIRVNTGRPLTVCAGCDNHRIAVGDSDGYVSILEAKPFKERMRLKTDAGSICAMAFGPDADSIAVAGDNKDIFIFNLITGNISTQFDGHGAQVNSLAFTPDGENLVCASNDLSTRWWDVNTQNEKKALTESTDKLLCMALSNDASLVALSVVDVFIDLLRHRRTDVRHIKVRNTVTGEEIRSLDGHQKDITTLDFHPDKRFLASGSNDDSVRIWDIQKGEMVTRLTLNDELKCVRFSHDGKWLAALSADNRLTVWKLK